jgi:hypothetical protein
LSRNVECKIIEDGYLTLKPAFKLVSPDVLHYKTSKGRRKLFQMPLAYVGVGDRTKGNYCFYVLQKQETVDYVIFQTLLAKATCKQSVPMANLSKCELKELLYPAESDSQREMLKYVTIKASGLLNSKWTFK